LTLSRQASKVLRVLRETGPRPLTIIKGLAGGTTADMQRVVGELFIQGTVKWVSAKRWRCLAAKKRAA